MMLALGMFVLCARRCHTRPCSVNQIIAGRQIPVSANGMPFSFSVWVRKTLRLPVCFIPN